MTVVVERGELLADRPELQVVLLADTEGLGATSARVSSDAPDGGLDPSSVVVRRID